MPTLCDGRLAPRHVDLRPFILSGEDELRDRGGLTRVALREGSLDRQLAARAAGSKDTWVVEHDRRALR